VREVNLPAASKSALPDQNRIIDGSTLMRDGLTLNCTKEFDSAVIEFTAEK
jgi:hypothetical protein